MGSVLALSGAGRQNWPFSSETPPPQWDTPPAYWDTPPRWERRDGRLPNPGSFHALHRSCKDVFPQQIEGVKMTVNKTLSSFFKASHTLHLSAVSPSQYRFHVEHRHVDSHGKDSDSPVLIGEMDSSGSLNAHSLLHLSERVRAKAVFQTQQAQFVTWQFEAEYRGSDFTAAVTMANPDILRESVILVAHVLQSVCSGLVLGGELVYHRGRHDEGGILTLAGQYTGPNWVATLNAGKGGAHASYYHRANKQIQVGVEFEASTRTQETTASFGYQMELPEANMVFRGMLNSRCIIGTCVSRHVEQQVYNRRSPGEAIVSSSCYITDGSLCESPWRQAAGRAGSQRGLNNITQSPLHQGVCHMHLHQLSGLMGNRVPVSGLGKWCSKKFPPVHFLLMKLNWAESSLYPHCTVFSLYFKECFLCIIIIIRLCWGSFLLMRIQVQH
uniref:Translocase of outer mitochondrial membrane 40 like n=1 Tax=Esox lucius TaxID=8010 RepID=A0AAY5KQ70_ESOLU